MAIVFIGFLGIFAFDVFVTGKSIWEMMTAFLIHLIPNFILIIALFIAWKKEELGGFLFILVGLFFTAFFQTYKLFSTFMLISFPVCMIGVLFLVHATFHTLQKK
ncbi:MAG: hypothetical protein KBD46_00390 [Candidatus Levybacteria bacterium]|nr:hypothetical protein [Candidatus Levybacteria bacterium]